MKLLYKLNCLLKCSFAVGDGRKGYPPEAPYDAIHVGAAAPELPEAVGFIVFVSWIMSLFDL